MFWRLLELLPILYFIELPLLNSSLNNSNGLHNPLHKQKRKSNGKLIVGKLKQLLRQMPIKRIAIPLIEHFLHIALINLQPIIPHQLLNLLLVLNILFGLHFLHLVGLG
jgi:hypothetical protein